MKGVVAAFLVCSACTTRTPTAVTLAAQPTSSASTTPIAISLTACNVSVGPPTALAIPARLKALGPQYFHPSGREGFNDLIAGTSRYTWYDPSDLDVPVDPPPDMAMIRRSTKSFWFGWSIDNKLHVARRTDATSTKTNVAFLSDVDAAEDASGRGWLLGGDLRIVRVDPSLAVEELKVAAAPSVDPQDHRVGVTRSGGVAVVWVAQANGALDVLASWLGPSGFLPPRTIDHVSIPPDAIALSLRSSTDLSVASHGRDGLAVAWRPLTPGDHEAVDVGSQVSPPPRAVSATVRIVTVTALGSASAPKEHSTRAQPLAFTSGMGPWALNGNGMVAAAVMGHAIFFWHDAGRVVYATPEDAAPRAITTGAYRLIPRESRSASELLLLQSVGAQSVVSVACR